MGSKTIKLDDYSDLRKSFNYDKAKASRLAEACNEAIELEARLKYLKRLVEDNHELQPFLWKTADSKVIALNDIEDDHLKNIVGHITRNNGNLTEQIRAEAESRGIDVDQIVDTTPKLRAFVDDDYYDDWDRWGDN